MSSCHWLVKLKFPKHSTFVVHVAVLDIVRGGVGGAVKKDLRPRSPLYHHRRAGHFRAEDPPALPRALRVIDGAGRVHLKFCTFSIVYLTVLTSVLQREIRESRLLRNFRRIFVYVDQGGLAKSVLSLRMERRPFSQFYSKS